MNKNLLLIITNTGLGVKGFEDAFKGLGGTTVHPAENIWLFSGSQDAEEVQNYLTTKAGAGGGATTGEFQVIAVDAGNSVLTGQFNDFVNRASKAA